MKNQCLLLRTVWQDKIIIWQNLLWNRKEIRLRGTRMVVQSSASIRTRWRECRSEFKTAFAYLFLFQLITIQLWGNTISDIEVMSIVWPRRYGQVLARWVKETAIIKTQIKIIRGKYFSPTRIWAMVSQHQKPECYQLAMVIPCMRNVSWLQQWIWRWWCRLFGHGRGGSFGAGCVLDVFKAYI